MSGHKAMIESREAMARWAKEENAPRVAIRVSGYGKQIEGWAIDDPEFVLVAGDDGCIFGGPTDVIEAVWFLGHWMSPVDYMRAR